MGCNHVPLFSNKQRVKLKGTHEKESLRGLDACSGFESTHYHTYTFYHFLPVKCFYQWFKPVNRWSGKFSKFTSLDGRLSPDRLTVQFLFRCSVGVVLLILVRRVSSVSTRARGES